MAVSGAISKRFARANIGDTMQIGSGSWRVVGIFDAGGTAHESEIWGDINQMAADLDRSVYSSILARGVDPVAAGPSALKDGDKIKIKGQS